MECGSNGKPHVRDVTRKALDYLPGASAVHTALGPGPRRGSQPRPDLCLRYNGVPLTQAGVTVGCNALHHVEARFCRWLLQTRDRAESDTVQLTQEFLAEMLGVRRTSVTEVAQKIQAAGAIRYSRGVIKIIDLDALKAMSCECYETLREQTGDGS